MKILIVDDDHATLKLCTAILHDYHEVTCAASGEQALVAAQRQQFDLVLMDLELPGMSGVEATRHLHSEGLIKYPSRVWGVSAHTTGDWVDDVLAAGARDFLSKPIRPAFLLARIKTVQESIDLHRENQKALKRWQAIFDLLPDPVTITSMDGKYIDVNQAYLDEIRLTKAEVIGKTPMELGIISQCERERLYRELKRSGRVSNMPIVYRYPHGELFHGSISARIVQNGTTYILAVTRNETETMALKAKTEEQADKIRSYAQISASMQEVAAAADSVLHMLQEVGD